MEYVKFGRTGLKVSPLCVGTVNLGWRIDEAASHALLDAAFDAGLMFIDTANNYGLSLTERIIGNWLAERPERRNQIVLATKVYGRMGEGPNDRGLSAYHIRQSVEDSLRRLGTDRIDLLQMHHVDRNVPWEEIWQAMERLVAEGKVLYVGSSNFAGWHIAQANEAAKVRHFMGLVSEQCYYNLIERSAELEILPAAQGYGLAVIPYSPLESGILAGGARASAEEMETDDERRAALESLVAGMDGINDLDALMDVVRTSLRDGARTAANDPKSDLPLYRQALMEHIAAELASEHGLELSTPEVTTLAERLYHEMGGGSRRRTSRESQRTLDRHAEAIARYEDFCKELGHPPGEVALAWLVHQPAITCPIIGPRTHEQIESSLRALEITLDAEVLATLDEIWPGPGGPAPEAFAW